MPPGPDSPFVIGLAGGIGAGKSAAARALARLGAVVIDSDKEVHDALDRPDVRAELARWWGPAVLAPDGRIDRARIAQIVFRDPHQRQRLESLIHPLLRTTRAHALEAARAAGAPAVVLDAPLLFEAGLDAHCDAVIFIDAPREARLDRLRLSRGWDAQELDRREKSQMPLEEKRRRADHVVQNDAGEAELTARIADAFQRILQQVDRREG
jgi:dephospho-CoA kinase